MKAKSHMDEIAWEDFKGKCEFFTLTMTKYIGDDPYSDITVFKNTGTERQKLREHISNMESTFDKSKPDVAVMVSYHVQYRGRCNSNVIYNRVWGR